jgi:hypothetical protein
MRFYTEHFGELVVVRNKPETYPLLSIIGKYAKLGVEGGFTLVPKNKIEMYEATISDGIDNRESNNEIGQHNCDNAEYAGVVARTSSVAVPA